MTAVQETTKMLTSAPIRGPGDGMETENPSKAVEPTSPVHTHHSPRRKAVPPPSPSLSPGVLQFGKIQSDKSVEIEAVRIVVPKAAIFHTVPGKSTSSVEYAKHHKAETFVQSDGITDPKKELADLKITLEKLKYSEKRLLQDKEGLSNQLRIQTEVNRELKKLLVASVGDDLQYHFERMAREKNQMILENEALGRNTSQLSEQLERMSIQCDVWRSKFLASRVMADELTNARTILQRQTRDAQGAIQDLLSEREQFRNEMTETHKLLEQLLLSLQWGREQTYHPRTQPYSTADLASGNHNLAKAVNSLLLGSINSSSAKVPPCTTEFCSTPAEKMAEKMLRVLHPVNCPEETTALSFSESLPSPFFPAKKNIGRFHPYTRYENITFNCCNRCSGELIAL